MPAARRIVLVFLYILIVWTAYRYFFAYPEWVDEFFVKPFVMVGPVLFVVLRLEGRNLFSLGVKGNDFWKNIAIGVGVGAFLLGESYLSQRLAGKHPGIVPMEPMLLLLNAGISLATAVVEEFVYRGYFFRRISEFKLNQYVAMGISALIFVVIHLPVMAFMLHYTGIAGVMYCVQIFLLGFIFAFVYQGTQTLVPTTVAHFLWNFANVILK